MNGLGILIIGGICVALVLVVWRVVIPLIDAPEGRHAETSDSEPAGWGERPPEIASEPRYHSAPPWAPAAAAPTAGPPPPVACYHGWPDADCGCGQPYAPPELSHDEFGPDQRWHPEPAPPAPDEAHQAAVAVGALIAVTAARVAAKDRARAAELEAEARATRPWADDTGTFTAICAEVA